MVIAPTIALIGLSLFDTPQVTAAGNDVWLLAFTLLLIVLFSQYLDASPPCSGCSPSCWAWWRPTSSPSRLSVAGVYAADAPGYVAMFGQIVAVGPSNLEYLDLDSSRNVFIVGVALFVGLALPAYMDNVGSTEAFRRGMAGVAVLGPVLGTRVVADTVYVIGSTGMAVGGLFAFVLDNTVEGSREERGLEEWEASAERDEDFASAYDRFVRDGDDDAPRAD